MAGREAQPFYFWLNCLERVPRANLHHARVTLNLREIRPIWRRRELVQPWIQSDRRIRSLRLQRETPVSALILLPGVLLYFQAVGLWELPVSSAIFFRL